MKWTSILAIYLLFWVFAAFVVLPFHGRSRAPDGGDGDGHDRGAPAEFHPRRILAQMTIVATISFAAYYALYVSGILDVPGILRRMGQPE